MTVTTLKQAATMLFSPKGDVVASQPSTGKSAVVVEVTTDFPIPTKKEEEKTHLLLRKMAPIFRAFCSPPSSEEKKDAVALSDIRKHISVRMFSDVAPIFLRIALNLQNHAMNAYPLFFKRENRLLREALSILGHHFCHQAQEKLTLQVVAALEKYMGAPRVNGVAYLDAAEKTAELLKALVDFYLNQENLLKAVAYADKIKEPLDRYAASLLVMEASLKANDLELATDIAIHEQRFFWRSCTHIDSYLILIQKLTAQNQLERALFLLEPILDGTQWKPAVKKRWKQVQRVLIEVVDHLVAQGSFTEALDMRNNCKIPARYFEAVGNKVIHKVACGLINARRFQEAKILAKKVPDIVVHFDILRRIDKGKKEKEPLELPPPIPIPDQGKKGEHKALI